MTKYLKIKHSDKKEYRKRNKLRADSKNYNNDQQCNDKRTNKLNYKCRELKYTEYLLFAKKDLRKKN